MEQDNTTIGIQIVKKQGQNHVGAAVLRRNVPKDINDKTWSLELYDYMDNDQFSSTDSLMIQLGGGAIYVSDEFQQNYREKVANSVMTMIQCRVSDTVVSKKALFRQADASSLLTKLVGTNSHTLNSVESSKSLAFGSAACLARELNLSDDDAYYGAVEIKTKSLNQFMKLDSAAAEAVNLLPKPDHPSQFGSIYGILNRCKTKMGSRLLLRWLRQPLLDVDEINSRLNIVEIFVQSSFSRSQLLEGPLRGIPDLDPLLRKLETHAGAGLSEIYRLYSFSKTLRSLESFLEELLTSNLGNEEHGESTAFESGKASIRERYLKPLAVMTDKCSFYQQFVEQLIDFDSVPDLMIAPQHDEGLAELKSEKLELYQEAQKLLSEASRSWASFAEIRLECNWNNNGFMFRATKGEDERQLRENNSKVRVVSILKTGCYFTIPKLESLSDRITSLDMEYKLKQRELIKQAVDTAKTYVPLMEMGAGLIAELDVLVAFAYCAALAPSTYTRPIFRTHSQDDGSGDAVSGNETEATSHRIHLKGARHPCVELMESVQFIPNDYNLGGENGKGSFQIVTGPNMGGKSTFIRGIGCIMVMAQVGAYVPCESADVSVVDCILARVGAGDAVQKGISTFMAEMLEASVILETATSRSLIIIDELGRGTSTFDGFGLAWAISEYIIKRVQCATLFATHFHELTALSQTYPVTVVNKHVMAHIEGKEVTMMYQVLDGPCNESFGIHVAGTAGFPTSVLSAAKRKASALEFPSAFGKCVDSSVATTTSDGQQAENADSVRTKMQKFSKMDLSGMTPDDIKANLLNLLAEE